MARRKTLFEDPPGDVRRCKAISKQDQVLSVSFSIIVLDEISPEPIILSVYLLFVCQFRAALYSKLDELCLS